MLSQIYSEGTGSDVMEYNELGQLVKKVDRKEIEIVLSQEIINEYYKKPQEVLKKFGLQ